MRPTITEDTVKITKHTVSNTVEITLTHWEEETQGGELKPREEKVWLDYDMWDDLVKAVTGMENFVNFNN